MTRLGRRHRCRLVRTVFGYNIADQRALVNMGRKTSRGGDQLDVRVTR